MVPKPIEKAAYEEIKEAILNYVSPRTHCLVVERTNFMGIEQKEIKTESDYHIRIKKNVTYCKFSDLKISKDPEAEIFRMKFISGLRNKALKLKLLQIKDDAPIEDLLSLCSSIRTAQRFIEKTDFDHKRTPEIDAIQSRPYHASGSMRTTQVPTSACYSCGGRHAPRQCAAYG